MANDLLTDAAAGARNLLQGCLRAQPGEKLLLLSESPEHGFYDRGAPDAVAEQAVAMGLSVDRREVPFVRTAEDADKETWERMREADCTVFFARLGDQIRFQTRPHAARAAMVYALDEGMLGSRYGIASHDGFVQLKKLIDAAVANASRIRLTCPLGTDLAGCFPDEARRRAEAEGEVAIRRFPMATFKPVPAAEFSGEVVISRFLTGTGHRYYTPYDLLLDKPVVARVAGGRVSGYAGPAEEVETVRRHVARVGERFGIDPAIIHSWHAGIHPGCAYLPDAFQNLARWGNAAFANPRLLHFHTCGDYAPGEISWNIVDPTIELDGVALWDNGVLHPERIPGGAELLAEWPDVREVFQSPRREIGF
ncbi:hypothetical protein [Marinimicrococcus flavescens]|uniref:Uncharacterized protein n=1 Tax=Marinimicrococcus flavescens TaxID=3031815 RepID=A0AAP3XR69_9PROT|nr:hypothetical protein [Marinimicrococcus flavescens]